MTYTHLTIFLPTASQCLSAVLTALERFLCSPAVSRPARYVRSCLLVLRQLVRVRMKARLGGCSFPGWLASNLTAPSLLRAQVDRTVHQAENKKGNQMLMRVYGRKVYVYFQKMKKKIMFLKFIYLNLLL